MTEILTQKDIDDGKKILELFSAISDGDKMMAIGYLSALKDKEALNNGVEKELQEA